MKVSAIDVDFIIQKFDFKQELEYLPLTFRQEADIFLQSNGIEVEIESAHQTYIALVNYFES